MKVLKQADYMGHEVAKLSKYVKTSGQTFSDSFLQNILKKKKKKKKKPETSFQSAFFVSVFYDFFSFVIYKFAKIHCRRLCLLPKFSVKFCSCFIIKH